ncbi:MAG: hypothetical protein F6K58_11580 [Symploca sp. SIO2E9]|nr:hypothetical protein [Symploca sp. SIO2E9]
MNINNEGERYYKEGIALVNRGDKSSAIASFQKAAEHFQSSKDLNRYEEAQAQIKQLRG